MLGARAQEGAAARAQTSGAGLEQSLSRPASKPHPLCSAGCRLSSAASTLARKDTAARAGRFPGEAASVLLPWAPWGLLSPSCLCHVPFWLKDCSLPSPKRPDSCLPMRYKSDRASTPRSRAHLDADVKITCSESKAVAHLPSQFISSCIDRSEKTSI